MPNLYQIAAAHRRAILQRERAAANDLVEAYGRIWRRLKPQLADVTAQIQAALAAGQPFSPSWLYRQTRYQAFLRQVEVELREFARYAEQRIRQAQQEAVSAAQAHVAEQMAAGIADQAPPGWRFDALGNGVRVTGGQAAEVYVSFHQAPVGAVQQLVGFLADGSPLRALLDALGPVASEGIRAALLTGLGTGQGPRQIARAVRRELGGDLVRALRISRTECLRSWREASRATYQANEDVVEGWIWHSALQANTCAACWAMHGTFHRLDETLDDHPNGRCSMVPVTKSLAEIVGDPSIPDRRVQVEPGEEILRSKPPEFQREVLGRAKWEAWNLRRIRLSDLVDTTWSDAWKVTKSEASLRTGLQRAMKRKRSWVVPEAKTAAAAEQIAKRMFGLKEVDYGGRADIGNMVNACLGDLRRAGMAPLDCAIRVDLGNFEGRNNARDILAEYAKRRHEIIFNPGADFWQSPREYAKRCHQLGWWPTDQPSSAIHHELAHALHQSRSPLFGASSPLLTRDLAIAKMVSGNAARSEGDFVADVFAGLMMGMEYNAEVMEAYLRLGGLVLTW